MGPWQQWLRMLAGLVLVIAFFDLLLPENDSKKLAKLIMGLVITAALIQPIMAIIASGWEGAVFTVDTGIPYGMPDYGLIHAGTDVQSAGMEPLRFLIGQTAASQLEALLITNESIVNAQVDIALADDGSVSQVQVTVWPAPAFAELPPDQQHVVKDWVAAITTRYLQLDPFRILVEFV